MDISSAMGDRAVLDELGRRVAQTRLRRNLTQLQLADEAGISRKTVERIEAGESIALSKFVAVLRVLNLSQGFDLLVPEPAFSPIEQLELSRGRLRARPPRETPHAESPPTTWRWGDEEQH